MKVFKLVSFLLCLTLAMFLTFPSVGVAESVSITQPNDSGIPVIDQIFQYVYIALPTDSGQYNFSTNTRGPGESHKGLTIYADKDIMAEHRHGIGVINSRKEFAYRLN